jgi:hypothetical protein
MLLGPHQTVARFATTTSSTIQSLENYALDANEFTFAIAASLGSWAASDVETVTVSKVC